MLTREVPVTCRSASAKHASDVLRFIGALAIVFSIIWRWL